MSSPFKSGETYAAMRESLAGQRIRIPNLNLLLPEWEPKIHDDYQKMRDEQLNPWIERWVDDEKTRHKLQVADFGLFAAIFCSKSSYEILCSVAKHFAWYFIWDDIFDCGALRDAPEEVAIYRDATVTYFKYILLQDGEYPDLSQFPTEFQKAIWCFDEVGEHIRNQSSKESCRFLLERMLSYIESVNVMDSLFSGEEVPSVKAYWLRRDCTAGAHCVIGTIPFAYGIDVTDSVLEDKHMALLWKFTSFLVHVTNDMLSFKKEFEHGQFESLIPILMMNKSLDCQECMHLSHHLCEQAVEGFDTTAHYLLRTRNEESGETIDAFVQGCEDVFMGLLYWSYKGRRYVQPEDIDAHQVIRYTLRDARPPTVNRPPKMIPKPTVRPTVRPMVSPTLYFLYGWMTATWTGFLVLWAVGIFPPNLSSLFRFDN